MKRRVTTSGKARRAKTAIAKRRTAAAVAGHGRASEAGVKEQLEQRTRELAEARKLLAEALEQQTATSDVLKVISSSPAELEPVFNTMLANALGSICEAKFGMLMLYRRNEARSTLG